MKVVSLHIQNFMAISEAKLRLDDRGLVLIQGENKDDSSANSNGAGKSSIADALCWCLYGETARGESGDTVVNDQAKSNCFVATDIEDGKHLYRIIRYRKSKIHKNALHVYQFDLPLTPGVAGLELTKGTDRLTQEVVEQIVGSSLEVFRAANYSGQEAMPNLPGMTDKQLKLLVEEAAGITVLERAYAIARSRLLSHQNEGEKLRGSIEGLLNVLDVHRKTRAELEACSGAWEGNKMLVLDRLNCELQAILKEIAELQNKEKLIDEVDLRRAIEELENRLKAVADERQREVELVDALQKAEASVAALETKASFAEQDLKKAKHALDHVTGRVGTACGECGKLYEEADIATARGLADSKVRDAARALDDVRKSLESAREVAAKAREALEAHRVSMTDVSETQASLSAKQKTLRELNELRHQINAKKVEGRSKMEQIKAKKAEENPHKAGIDKAVKLIEDTEHRIKELQEKLAAHNLVQTDLDNAVKVFSPAGVRAHILDTVTPFLNDRTAHYLAHLSDGNIQAVWTTLTKTAKGELREKFSIDVTHSKGAKRFAGLSGGEKRKVRLACALALQDLVASRATKPIDLWIGDEIDHALDTSGLERLMIILEQKARERGTVLVISHNDISDWIRETVTVTKRGGVSTVQGAICIS